MSTLPVIFLAFANDSESPLPRLTEEDKAVYDLLYDRSALNHYELHRDSNAELDSLRKYLTKFRDRVMIFHYAGHAESDALMLTSGAADAGGIAEMLAEQSPLKLVFLNGCSTRAQVDKLIELGVPAVIATHAPINDEIAANFARHFYESLVLGTTIREAYEAAASYAKAGGKEVQAVRSWLLRKPVEEQPPETVWALFHHEEKAHILDERLPKAARVEVPEDYEPNTLLIQGIWQALAEYGLVASRKKPKIRKMRMDILNLLPAPISEQLRKLFVQFDQETDEGYDRISYNRLLQLARCFQVLQEFISFSLFAQLWERYLDGYQEGIAALQVPADLKKDIAAFLKLSAEERETFSFLPLMKSVRELLDNYEIEYFIEELGELEELLSEGHEFRKACSYFDILRKRLQQESEADLSGEIGELCVESEQQLTLIFESMGFLAQYTLATVNRITVQKHRHKPDATYRHTVVEWVDLLGGTEVDDTIFQNFLDSESVLLLKDEEEDALAKGLNLSPFIIDQNAFDDQSDVPKIYFFHHKRSDIGKWVFRWVNHPEDPPLLLPDRQLDASYKIVEELFDAFETAFC